MTTDQNTELDDFRNDYGEVALDLIASRLDFDLDDLARNQALLLIAFLRAYQRDQFGFIPGGFKFGGAVIL